MHQLLIRRVLYVLRSAIRLAPGCGTNYRNVGIGGGAAELYRDDVVRIVRQVLSVAIVCPRAAAWSSSRCDCPCAHVRCMGIARLCRSVLGR